MNFRDIRLGALLLMAFALIGCSSIPRNTLDGSGAALSKAPTIQDKETNWRKRQQALLQRQNWSMNGRVGVSYRNDAWPFNIVWQQQGESSYVMSILHPLTRSQIAIINKDLGGVRLKMADGRTYSDSSAERLLARHLNVQIPVDGMQYWVRGLPAPLYRVDQVNLDERGRPLAMAQAGWSVRYAGFRGEAYDAMPTKIRVERSSPEKIKVVVSPKVWQ